MSAVLADNTDTEYEPPEHKGTELGYLIVRVPVASGFLRYLAQEHHGTELEQEWIDTIVHQAGMTARSAIEDILAREASI